VRVQTGAYLAYSGCCVLTVILCPLCVFYALYIAKPKLTLATGRMMGISNAIG